MAREAGVPPAERSLTSLFTVIGPCATVAGWERAAARYPEAMGYRGAPVGSLAVLRELCLSGMFGVEITNTPLCRNARQEGLSAST